MTSWIIAGSALVLYALFWSWYVGFGRKVSAGEIEQVMQSISAMKMSPEGRENMRRFLAADDGRDFVMVNALHVKEPRAESRVLLDKYSKAFLGDLLKRAGHPVLMAYAAAANIENLHCETADNWTAAGLVRYRSRRDFARMIIAFAGSEHHGYKLAALEKTFAFPASPWFIFGGPRWIVGLVLALAAALVHIALV